MALINFYKGLKENYSSDTHGNSIYSCTDTNECYILGVLYENISEEEITNKIGTNTYTDANYISKETNLTDAAMQLDEEIKATNDNIDILNAATVKGVATISASNKVEVQNGIAVIPLLSDNNSGVLDASYYRFINNGYDANIPILGSNSSGDYIFAGYKDDNGLRLPITSTLDPDTTEYFNGGLMSSTDYEKLNNIENTYVPLTGDSFKNNNACWGGTAVDGTTYCLALIDESDRLKIGNSALPLYLRGSSIQFDDNSGDYYTVYHSNNFKAGVDYVAPETLNTYLPLSGGTITGVVKHSANVDLDNGKYIQAYTTSGSLYPILFIDSGNDFVVGSNGTETRIRSNDTNLIHDTTSGRYTIYDSHNLDINKWNVPQYTGDYNLIAKSGLTYWNNAAGEVNNVPVDTTTNPYGIMATFGNFTDGHAGESNVWGFQLACGSHDDGTLYYRDFLGLTIKEWDQIVTSKNLLTKGITLDQGVGIGFQNNTNTNATGFLWIDKELEDVNQVTEDDYVAGMGLLDGSYSDDGVTTPRIFISCNSTKKPWQNGNGLQLNATTIEFNGNELATKEDTQPIIINIDSNLPADPTRAAQYTKLHDESYHNIVLQGAEGNYYPISSSSMISSITFNYAIVSSGSLVVRRLTLNKDGSTISS